MTLLYGAPGLHLYVHKRLERKKLMRELFVMEEVEFSATSVSRALGMCSTQIVSGAKKVPFWYHSYLTLQNHHLSDALASGYGGSTGFGSKRPRCLQKKVYSSRRTSQIEL